MTTPQHGSARLSTASCSTIARSTSAATTRWCGARRHACRCCAARAATPPSRWPCRSNRSADACCRRRAEEHVSVAKRDWVVPSHHIGDLEHLATYRSFLQAVEHLPRLYGVVPDVVVHDMHPEYLSSKWAARARPAHARRAAPSRPRRGMHGRARPSRPGARNRLRRPRLRHRRHAVGWRAARRRLRDVASASPIFARCACPEAWRRSASRGAWALVWCATASTDEDAARRTAADGIDDATGMTVHRSRQATGIPGHHECRPAVRRGRRAARLDGNASATRRRPRSSWRRWRAGRPPATPRATRVARSSRRRRRRPRARSRRR